MNLILLMDLDQRSAKFRSYLFSRFSVVFVIVDAGRELVLEEPKSTDDTCWHHNNGSGEGEGEGESLINYRLPKKALLKSQKILLVKAIDQLNSIIITAYHALID